MTSIPAVFVADLHASERPVLLVRAQVPRQRTGGYTHILVHAFLWVADAVRGRRHMKAVRERSAALGFPLDRHMSILLTNERLRLWRTSSGRAPEHLGDVDLVDVRSVRLPFVGGGPWRFVELELKRGVTVRFQVEGARAEELVSTLDPIIS